MIRFTSYHEPLLEQWKKQSAPSLQDKLPLSTFIIEHLGSPIGCILVYPLQEPFNRMCSEPTSAVVMDICLEDHIENKWEAHHLKTFLSEHVFPTYHACLVHPFKHHKLALSTYAKAGFTTLDECSSHVVMVSRKESVPNPIIILGSSRSDGNTLKAIKAVFQQRPVPLIDLRNLNLSFYDYAYKNTQDDFIPLAETMVRHNPIILATPVYWYSMSALMKTFIDRWSDLLAIRKDIGRRLTNKELYVITSYGESVPKGFEDPFSQTCEYLDMHYKGCYYFYGGDDPKENEKNAPAAFQFSELLFN